MEQYYLALNPDKNLTKLINEQKILVEDSIGNQTYLHHPPHFTLIIFTTDNLDKIILELENLAKKIPKINIVLKDLYIFYNDSLTNGHTIAYSVSEENIPILREIQLKTVNAIDKFNTKKFVYPFIGDVWIPHITLASIEPDKFDLIFDKIKQNSIQGEFLIDSINLYRVGDENSFLIRSFELG